jgi:hypothetical protein
VLTLLKPVGQTPGEVGVATVKMLENLILESIMALTSAWVPEASLIHETLKAPPLAILLVCRSPACERKEVCSRTCVSARVC